MNVIDRLKHPYKVMRKSYRKMTNQIRLLPDFIIIGGQRCGTTSLYFYLTELPGVSSALYKEVQFFDDHFAEGVSWYRARFPTILEKYRVEQLQRQHFMTGESSPYYLVHPHVPKWVAQLLPKVKLIALLRNPVDRAYSHHWLSTEEGTETLPFEQAIRCEEERLAGEYEKMLADESYTSYNHRHFSYLARGIYVDQLQNWLKYFPSEQLLLLKSEDLYRDPLEILRKTATFLEIPDTALKKKEFKQYREPGHRGYKNKQKPPKMDAALRASLVDYFRPHNARLYEFLGQDLGWDE